MKRQFIFILLIASGLLFLVISPVNDAHADLVDPCLGPQLEAQMLALEVSGQLRPPPDLTQRIFNDLCAIRTAHPELAHISYRLPAAPDEIIIGLTKQAAEQFSNGQYHALDGLNELYGVIEIDVSLLTFISAIVLKFDQVYNTQLLAGIYLEAAPEGLRYATPNHTIGDGSTIHADPPLYIFTRAWGDCPAG